MEDEGLLVLSQAQMDSVGAMEPVAHDGEEMTFANEGQLPVSEAHSNSKSEPVDATTSTQATAGETRATTSLKARKRTKTGCLTCRKRRIKCGEERPTCSNCVKSKRNCEGYTPRVVFKDPLGSFRPAGGGSQQGHGVQYQQTSRQNGAAGQYGRMQSTSSSQASLPAIRPRPSVLDGQTELTSMTAASIPDVYSSHGQMHHSKAYPPSDLPPRIRHLYNGQQSFTNSNQAVSDTAIRKSITSKPSFYHQNTSESDSGVDMGPPSQTSEWSHSFSTSFGFPKGYVRNDTGDTSLPITQIPASCHTAPSPYTQFGEEWGRGHNDSHSQSTQLNPFIDGDWSAIKPQPDEAFFSPETPFQNASGQPWAIDGGFSPHVPDSNGHNYIAPQLYHYYSQHHRLNVKAPIRYIQPSPMQPPVAVDDPEDDPFDVDSDREMGTTGSQLGNTPRSDLGLLLALSASQDDRSLRSITNFLDNPNVLATYQPSYTASPLMDPQTARVFCHFVTATGPSMSIFERHPTNPTVMFTGTPVPSSQQALWTYTLPMMALSHQGLLHAMLALASLHIAKLQHTSPAPSLKHYHFALRRVAKAVGLPSKRQGIATLAATLLLGFYEATTAEHNKWNSHLAGARQLVMEIDFAGTTKQIKEQNARAEPNKYHRAFSGYQDPYTDRRFSDDVSLDVDNGLISTLMGWKSHSDQYGRIIDHTASNIRSPPLTPKDIETYQIQRDLFWWYCKQDVFQSALSGNRLLMPYERWDHCPPRAPVGRLGAVYGTMDHLVLLLARIVDFAAKDQRRKNKAVEANGGQWKPPPGMFPSQSSGRAPQSGKPSHPQTPPTAPPNNSSRNGLPDVLASPQGGPPMYGMIPPTGPVRIPTGFIQGPRDHISPPNLSNEEIELEAATLEAEAEWNDLRNTLDIFEESLGPDYQPLSPEHMQPLSTPFGPALYYRTYSISCIWTLFYMGRIIAARVHPSMPPAMMAAAGIAAPRTAEWATLIGRICAGLQPVSNSAPLHPSRGAALIESTLGLFFAAVQFRHAAQRGWTITKLRDIARLTGWQSSAAIAAGCETSWLKAWEAGRGPPYARTMEPTARDDRVAGRRPWDEGAPPKDSNDRRFITVNAGTRVHWALGLLSVEEDMRQLSLSKTG